MDDFIDNGNGTTIYRRINISNTITFVDTAVDSNAIVLLSNYTNIGEIYTVKDTGGLASDTYPIVISTITTTSFSDSTVSNYQIQQPFGYMSFISINSSQWSILNTFTNNTGSSNTESTIQNPQVNSIIFNDIFSIGETPIVNVNNGILELNGNLLEDINTGSSNIVATNLLVQSNISGQNTTISNVSYIQERNQFIAIGYGNMNISYNGTTWTTTNTPLNNYIGKYLTTRGNDIIGVFWNFINETTFKVSIQSKKNIQRTDSENIWNELYVSDNFIYTNVDSCVLKCGTKFNILVIQKELYYSTSLGGPWFNIFSLSSPGTDDYIYAQDCIDISDDNYLMISSSNSGRIHVYSNAIISNEFSTSHKVFPSVENVNGNTINIENYISDRITTIKYSPNCNVFMLCSRKIYSDSSAIYFLNNDGLFPNNLSNISNAISSVRNPSSFNSFTIYNAYINEGTVPEIGLPNIIYFGLNSNENNNIAYTYDTDIYNQVNFIFITTQTPITTYTITNGVFYIPSGNTVITINSNNFIDPITNPPTLNTTSLDPINSIINRNYIVPNSETLLEVSGTLATNFLRLIDTSSPDESIVRIYQPYNGYIGINKNFNNIKAFLEIKYTTGNTNSTNIYPIGLNVSNVGGLFMQDNNDGFNVFLFKRSITAVILEPEYMIQIYNETNFQGGYIQRINTTFYPIHIDIVPTIPVQPNAEETPFSCRLSRVFE